MEVSKMEKIMRDAEAIPAEEKEQYVRALGMFIPAYNAGCRDGYKTGYAEGLAKAKKKSWNALLKPSPSPFLSKRYN